MRAPAAALLALAACATAGRGWVTYPKAEAAQVKDPHSYRGQPLCQACHLGERPALLAGPVGTCQHCHPARHTPGHEAGTPLPAARVGGLPLVEGRLVCHTCHDAHDVKRHRFGLRLPLTQLCRSCHPKH